MLMPPIVSSIVRTYAGLPNECSPTTRVKHPHISHNKDNTIRASKHSTRSSKKKVVSEEDEERFMFGQEFIAVTTALFDSEVLPAFPNYPGMSSGLTPRNFTLFDTVTGWGTYKTFLHPWLQEASTHYTFGLDIVFWLSDATACPPPISPRFPFDSLLSPLIGLTQLVQ